MKICMVSYRLACTVQLIKMPKRWLQMWLVSEPLAVITQSIVATFLLSEFCLLVIHTIFLSICLQSFSAIFLIIVQVLPVCDLFHPSAILFHRSTPTCLQSFRSTYKNQNNGRTGSAVSHWKPWNASLPSWRLGILMYIHWHDLDLRSNPELYVTYLVGHLESRPSSKKQLHAILYTKSEAFKALKYRARDSKINRLWSYIERYPESINESLTVKNSVLEPQPLGEPSDSPIEVSKSLLTLKRPVDPQLGQQVIKRSRLTNQPTPQHDSRISPLILQMPYHVLRTTRAGGLLTWVRHYECSGYDSKMLIDRAGKHALSSTSYSLPWCMSLRRPLFLLQAIWETQLSRAESSWTPRAQGDRLSQTLRVRIRLSSWDLLLQANNCPAQRRGNVYIRRCEEAIQSASWNIAQA